jgi:hypothetical protein
MDVPGGATVIDAPTFSKWGPELAAVVPEGAEMVLTGVATDCCVLSTALGAVDGGRFVTVVSDACAAVSDEGRTRTWALALHHRIYRTAINHEHDAYRWTVPSKISRFSNRVPWLDTVLRGTSPATGASQDTVRKAA